MKRLHFELLHKWGVDNGKTWLIEVLVFQTIHDLKLQGIYFVLMDEFNKLGI